MKDGDINPIERHPSRERLQPEHLRNRHTRKISAFPTNLIFPIIFLGIFSICLSSIYSHFKSDVPQIIEDFKKLLQPSSKRERKNQAIYNEASINKKRILFIGNSLTSKNKVPAQVCNILNSSNKLKRIEQTSAYICEQKTKGGYWLAHHYRDLRNYNKKEKTYSLKRKYKKNWSWVIFQEQSVVPGVSKKHKNYKYYRNALKNLSKLFERRSKNLALYMTWAHKDGHLKKEFRERFPNFETMNELLETGYLNEINNLAKNNLYLTQLPAGRAFAQLKNNFGEEEFKKLYSSDRHATISGSYLAALVISAGIIKEEENISEKDWLQINWKPKKVSKQKALWYKEIAWRVTDG